MPASLPSTLCPVFVNTAHILQPMPLRNAYLYPQALDDHIYLPTVPGDPSTLAGVRRQTLDLNVSTSEEHQVSQPQNDADKPEYPDQQQSVGFSGGKQPWRPVLLW